MGAQATGSKLDGLMVLGLEGARALVVGVGVFMLRREMVFSVSEVDGCESEGDGNVVKEECLGVHADLVTLRVSGGVARLWRRCASLEALRSINLLPSMWQMPLDQM
jgi:hypothetical protein